MRGDEERQEGFIWLSSGDELVPQGHPLRKIRRMVDQALSQMSPLFDSLYACGGRNSSRASRHPGPDNDGRGAVPTRSWTLGSDMGARGTTRLRN